MNANQTILLFQGLDTFATIELCGAHVAATNNQFRQYYFDVTDILKQCDGDVSLGINFGSAPDIAKAIAEQPGQEQWAYGIQIPCLSICRSICTELIQLTLMQSKYSTDSSSASNRTISGGIGVPPSLQQGPGSPASSCNLMAASYIRGMFLLTYTKLDKETTKFQIKVNTGYSHFR